MLADRAQHGFFVRLYTGTGAFEVIGRRKLVVHRSADVDRRDRAVASIAAFAASPSGIDFEGGTKVSMPAAGDSTAQQVEEVFSQDTGQGRRNRWCVVGSGGSATVQIRSGSAEQRGDRGSCAHALFDAFQPKGADGQPSKQAISDSAVSETLGRSDHREGAHRAWWCSWCSSAIYITVRYERYMAMAALADTGVRPDHHRGRLLACRVRGHPGDRHRPADHPRLLAVRHGHRVRQGRGEHPRLPNTPPGARSPNRPTWPSTRRSCGRSTPA